MKYIYTRHWNGITGLKSWALTFDYVVYVSKFISSEFRYMSVGFSLISNKLGSVNIITFHEHWHVRLCPSHLEHPNHWVGDMHLAPSHPRSVLAYSHCLMLPREGSCPVVNIGRVARNYWNFALSFIPVVLETDLWDGLLDLLRSRDSQSLLRHLQFRKHQFLVLGTLYSPALIRYACWKNYVWLGRNLSRDLSIHAIRPNCKEGDIGCFIIWFCHNCRIWNYCLSPLRLLQLMDSTAMSRHISWRDLKKWKKVFYIHLFGPMTSMPRMKNSAYGRM